MTTVKVGSKVRDKSWGGVFTGTVTRVGKSGQVIVVAWDNTVVEDEVHIDDVEVIA